jgi:hypothetical protein
MQKTVVKDVPSKYLYKEPEETIGGPLDRRLYLSDGLDWDLLRKNYRANASLAEGIAQDEALKSTTGRYSPKKGKYVLEAEEDVEEQWKAKNEPVPAAKVKKIHQYTDIGVSQRQIAKDLGLNVKTVARYQDKRREEEGNVSTEHEGD